MASGITVGNGGLFNCAPADSKDAKATIGFSALPEDMLEMIFKYLADSDLRKMAQIDSTCRRVALKERAMRVLEPIPRNLRELFSRDNQRYNYRAVCPVEVMLKRLTNCGYIPGYQDYLSKFIASAITNLEVVCGSFKDKLTARINQRCLSLENIERSPEGLKNELVAQALISMISASEDPVLTLGNCITMVAASGLRDVLKSLLDLGAISEELRSLALQNAASNEHAHVAEVLLENGPVSERAISEAFDHFSIYNQRKQGCVDICRQLKDRKEAMLKVQSVEKS
jgi:hypothetical protein